MFGQALKYFIFGILGLALIAPMALMQLGQSLTDPRALIEALRSGKPPVLRSQTRETGAPLAHLVYHDDQWRADDAITATAVGMPVFRSEVFAEWQASTMDDVPRIVGRFPVTQTCDPPSISGRAVLLRAPESPLRAGLQAWDRETFREAVDAIIAAQRATNKVREVKAMGVSERAGFAAYDVAVTDPGPVHLVLLSRGKRMVWNLHLATGAELAGVTLIGGAGDALANVPEGVPVLSLSREALAGCGVVEAYPYEPDGFFYRNHAAGVVSDEEFARMNAEMDAKAAVWEDWLRQSFGVAPGTQAIGYDAGASALIGPVPAEPVPWRGLAQAPVLVGDTEDEVIARALTDGDGFYDAAMTRALELAGGSFEMLRAHPKPAVVLGGL